MALFHLEEFEAAKAALEEGQRLDPSSKQFKPWIRKCQAELDGEGGQICPRIGDQMGGLPAWVGFGLEISVRTSDAF